MFRFLIGAVCLAVLSGTIPAMAQSPPPKPKSPGEIAAADRLKAEKTADCRREAKAKKLSFLKRRLYIKNCVKR